MKKNNYMSFFMIRRGVLLPIVVFLILGIAAVFPLLISMSETTLNRTQYSEEWARIQWAIEGANQRQLASTSGILDPFSGVVTTIATFTYPESGGSFDVAVAISEGRTLLARHRNLSATARAYRNGIDAGYNLSGLSAATVSVPGVAAGGEHSFAWKKDGTLFSWGGNNSGQLGLGDNDSPCSTPQQTLSGVSLSSSDYYTQGWMVAGGGSHTLALDYYGKVYSWGRNDYGQLGHSGTTNKWVPQIAPGSVLETLGFSDLAAGDDFSLGLANSGDVYSWGRNSVGQLGRTSNSDEYTPVKLQGGILGLRISGIAAGSRHALAISAGGNIYGWGDNNRRQLGMRLTSSFWSPTPTWTNMPVKINDSIATIVVDIPYVDTSKNPAANVTKFYIPVSYLIGSFSVDVREHGGSTNGTMEREMQRLSNSDKIFVRLNGPEGAASNRDLRPNNTSTINYGLTIEGPFDPQRVDGSETRTFLWIPYIFYFNRYRLVYTAPPGAAPLAPGTYTVSLVSGRNSSYNNSLRSNWYKDGDINSPTYGQGIFSFCGQPVEEPTGFFGVAAGAEFSMAVNRSGSLATLYTWGNNDQGQLGHNDKVQRNRMAPVNNSFFNNERIRTICAGREHALALTEGGNVYSWGNNANGQLGRAVTTANTAEKPVQIPATNFNSRKVTGIAAGAYHSLAIDEDGKVYSWGLNSNGRLGRTGSTASPGLVSGFP